MIPVSLTASHICVIEHCPVAILAKHKAFSTEMMRIKALREVPVFPSPRQPAMPDDVPTGGGSGGGAIMGGEGAPGSGTGVPGIVTGLTRKLF